MPRPTGLKYAPHILGIATLASFLARPCAAQPVSDDERQLFTPLPSVFTASRFDQSIADAPSAVTVITAEDIHRHGYRTLAEVLGSARGFFVTNDQNYAFLGVRGFARTGDFNSRMLVLIDGHRVNDNVYGTASLGGEAIIDVSLIERVEIVRGPTSSLYGANAIFGTANIITRRGRDIAGTRIELGLGDRGTRSGQGTVGGRLENGLEYLASASSRRTDGETSLFYPEFDSPANNGGIARNLDRDQVNRLFAKFQFEDTGFTAAISDRSKLVPTGSFGTVFNDPGTRTNDAQMFVELRHRADLAGGDLRARVFHDSYAYSGNFTYNRPPWLVNKDSATGKWWGWELGWSAQISPTHRFSTGAEFRKNNVIRQRNYDSALNLDDRRSDSSWGVYVQDEWRIVENLVANIGIRHDIEGSRSGRWSPRAALNYRPRESTTIKLIQGSAHRPPNAYELYYNDGNSTQKANPGLRSESIRTTELVLEERLTERWRASFGTYRYKIHNLVTQRADPADNLLVFFNQGAIEAQGYELESSATLSNGVEASASLANQSNLDRNSGGGLVNSPRNLFKSRWVVPLPGNWRGGLSADYMGARRTLSGSEAGSFWLVNLTFTHDRIAPGVKVSFSAHNLFNRRYADPGAPEHTQILLKQPGRSILAKIEFTF
jgi:outer membrane receptor protein involved in Fe transport